MLGEKAAGQAIVGGGRIFQQPAGQQQRFVGGTDGAGPRVIARDRVAAGEHVAGADGGSRDHRRLRGSDGDRRAGQDFAVGQARRGGDRAAVEALDADRQEVGRQVALDQHRGATGADEIPGAGAAEHRCAADLDEVRSGRIPGNREKIPSSQPFFLGCTIGVSPVSWLWPRAEFSRSRWASFCGSSTIPGCGGLRQNISLPVRPGEGRSRRAS